MRAFLVHFLLPPAYGDPFIYSTLGRAVFGLGTDVLWVSQLVWVSTYWEGSLWATWSLTMVAAMPHLGRAVGEFVSREFVDHFPFDAPFWFASGFSVMVLLITLWGARLEAIAASERSLKAWLESSPCNPPASGNDRGRYAAEDSPKRNRTLKAQLRAVWSALLQTPVTFWVLVLACFATSMCSSMLNDSANWSFAAIMVRDDGSTVVMHYLMLALSHAAS